MRHDDSSHESFFIFIDIDDSDEVESYSKMLKIGTTRLISLVLAHGPEFRTIERVLKVEINWLAPMLSIDFPIKWSPAVGMAELWIRALRNAHPIAAGYTASGRVINEMRTPSKDVAIQTWREGLRSDLQPIFFAYSTAGGGLCVYLDRTDGWMHKNFLMLEILQPIR